MKTCVVKVGGIVTGNESISAVPQYIVELWSVMVWRNPESVTYQSMMVHTQMPKFDGATLQSAMVYIYLPKSDDVQVFSTHKFSSPLSWQNDTVPVWWSSASCLRLISYMTKPFSGQILTLLYNIRQHFLKMLWKCHNNMMSQTLINCTIGLWRVRLFHFGISFEHQIYTKKDHRTLESVTSTIHCTLA
jgi:hypothetical protein